MGKAQRVAQAMTKRALRSLRLGKGARGCLSLVTLIYGQCFHLMIDCVRCAVEAQLADSEPFTMSRYEKEFDAVQDVFELQVIPPFDL